MGKYPIRRDQVDPVLVAEFTANSQAQMLGLVASIGDYCFRSDNKQLYRLEVLPASTLSNWQQITISDLVILAANAYADSKDIRGLVVDGSVSGNVIIALNGINSEYAITGSLSASRVFTLPNTVNSGQYVVINFIETIFNGFSITIQDVSQNLLYSSTINGTLAFQNQNGTWVRVSN